MTTRHQPRQSDSLVTTRFQFCWKRILRLSLTGTATALILLIVGSSWLYTSAMLHPGCQGNRDSLEVVGFASEPVVFPSRNGPVLRGWYTAGDKYPETVIIAVPGHAGNSALAIPNATIMAEAGFSTLIYEHRSCANPSLAASTGYYEAYDLLGAVDYLTNRSDVEHIGTLGFSEGGTASILATAQEPALEAIVAIGGYENLAEDILDPAIRHGALGWTIRRFILLFTSLQLGIPAWESSPVSVIDKIGPRPILLIYGEYEAESGQVLYDSARAPKDLWIVARAEHGQYQEVAPEEYKERIVAFFEDAFR
ncbi:MAG: hypothetical protein JXB07_02350 [Anaerolineae bacterium]|nr:hypothetical protein [Anaerolineae bacterium]